MKTPRRLSLLVLSFFMILLGAGCGGSNADIIVNSSGGGGVAPPAPGTTGNLAFRFAQAQAATLPRGAVLLDFNFFASDDGPEVFFDAVEFAPTVTIENVPVHATRVVITAYGPGRVPLASFSADVNVVADTTTIVDLSQVEIRLVTFTELLVDPVSVSLTLPGSASAQLVLSGRFSNADVIPFDDEVQGAATFVSANPAIATVSADGRVTGVDAGSTTVDVSYTLNGQTQTRTGIPVQVTGSLPPVTPTSPARLVFSPPSISIIAGASAPVTVSYFAPNSSTGVDVTANTTGTSNLPAVTFAAGSVSAANTITAATSATVTINYNNGSANVTGDLNVNVTTPSIPPPPALGRLNVIPNSITLTNAGLLGLIGGGLPETEFGFFEASFIPTGQTAGADVTKLVGASFKDFFPAAAVANSFSFTSFAGRAVVMTSNPLGPTPPYGTTCTMTVTYIQDGVVYTDDVKITVGTPSLDRVEVLGVKNGVIRLPAPNPETVYTVQALAHYSNGYYEPIDFDSGGPTAFGDSFGLDPLPDNEFTGPVFASTDNTPRSISVDVLDTTTGSAKLSASFAIQLVADLSLSSVSIGPDPIVVNGVGKYRIIANYNDGSKLDVTGIWPIVDGVLFEGENCGCGPTTTFIGELTGLAPGLDVLLLGSGPPLSELTLPGTFDPATQVVVKVVSAL